MNTRLDKDVNSIWSQSLADDLFRFLTGRVRCPQIAMELTHDTYLHLRQAANRTTLENERAMAFRIAMNLAIDHQRKENLREKFASGEDFDAVSVSVAAPEPGPEQVLSQRQRLETLRKALDQLPPDARTSFLLHGVEGLTYAEIADRLGVSKAQVNKLLAMAMRHCASQLD